MPETLLLTGAASPLGRAVAAALAGAGERVRPTDAVDLTDPDRAAELVVGVDAIVHLAPLVLAERPPEGARAEPAHLAPYLAELVAREFARDPQLDRPLSVVCLRLAGPDDLPVATAAE